MALLPIIYLIILVFYQMLKSTDCGKRLLCVVAIDVTVCSELERVCNNEALFSILVVCLSTNSDWAINITIVKKCI